VIFFQFVFIQKMILSSSKRRIEKPSDSIGKAVTL